MTPPFHLILRAIRVRAGYDATYCARAAGIAPSTWLRAEEGSDVRLSTIQAMSDGLASLGACASADVWLWAPQCEHSADAATILVARRMIVRFGGEDPEELPY